MNCFLFRQMKDYAVTQFVDDAKTADETRSSLPQSAARRFRFHFEDGMASLFDAEKGELLEVPSFAEYLEDLQSVLDPMAYGPAKTLCYERLKILQCRFQERRLILCQAI